MAVLCWLASVMSDSATPSTEPDRLLCTWGFSRQEQWSVLPSPPAGARPNSGTEPMSPALQADAVPSELQGSPRIVEWVAYPFSSRSSQSKKWTWVSCIADGLFTCQATKEAQTTWLDHLKRRRMLFRKSKCEQVNSEQQHCTSESLKIPSVPNKDSNRSSSVGRPWSGLQLPVQVAFQKAKLLIHLSPKAALSSFPPPQKRILQVIFLKKKIRSKKIYHCGVRKR